MAASSTPDLLAPLGRRKRDETIADDVATPPKRRSTPSDESLEIRRNMRQAPSIRGLQASDIPYRQQYLSTRPSHLVTILHDLSEHCSGSLQQHLSKADFCQTVVEKHSNEVSPLILKAIDDDAIWDEVCSFLMDTIPAHSTHPMESVEVEESKSAQQTVEESWNEPFKGSLDQLLFDCLEDYAVQEVEDAPLLYGHSVAIINSSGTGKTRTVDRLGLKVPLVPVNLASSSATTFPPPDCCVRDWLDKFKGSYQTHNGAGQPEVYKHMQALLYGILVTALDHLKVIEEEKGLATKTGLSAAERRNALALAFHEKLAEGMTFKQHGPYRVAFHKSALAMADVFYDKATMPETPPSTEPNQSNDSGSPLSASKMPESSSYQNLQSTSQSPLSSSVAAAAERLYQFLEPQVKSSTQPMFIISFDESHGLTDTLRERGDDGVSFYPELRRAIRQMRRTPSLWVLFLATSGKFHLFSPDRQYERSDRLVKDLLRTFPPITEVEMDKWAQHVPCDGTWSLDRIASTYNISHLGRALFPTRYDHGSEMIQRTIVRFARIKLLGGRKVENADQRLACLAVRLALSFQASNWLQTAAERRQVERHMRICLGASTGKHSMITIAASEPLLAEAAVTVMGTDAAWRVAEALLEHIDSSYISLGDRGEVVASAILMEARDAAVAKKPVRSIPEDPTERQNDGSSMGRVITVIEFLQSLLGDKTSGMTPSCSREEDEETTIETAFKDCYVCFNHFLRVEDYEVLNQGYLWRIMCRCAAVICANNQRGVDLVVPILKGKHMDDKRITAILIQVKNDVSFKATIKPWLYDAMSPGGLGLFADNASPLPVIRLVFALASTESAVIMPKRGQRSPRTAAMQRYTSYDIWCAGATTATFPSVRGSDAAYAKLLLLTRGMKYQYASHHKFSVADAKQATVEIVRRREDVRRRMNPGASSNPAHYENYVRQPPSDGEGEAMDVDH